MLARKNPLVTNFERKQYPSTQPSKEMIFRSFDKLVFPLKNLHVMPGHHQVVHPINSSGSDAYEGSCVTTGKHTTTHAIFA